jgi:hypothetical protein
VTHPIESRRSRKCKGAEVRLRRNIPYGSLEKPPGLRTSSQAEYSVPIVEGCSSITSNSSDLQLNSNFDFNLNSISSSFAQHPQRSTFSRPGILTRDSDIGETATTRGTNKPSNAERPQTSPLSSAACRQVYPRDRHSCVATRTESYLFSWYLLSLSTKSGSVNKLRATVRKKQVYR